MKDFFFFWKKRYWQLSRWETGHLVWSGPHLYVFQMATLEGEMKPCHHRLSVSHVLTCLGQFLLTFSLFFFPFSVDALIHEGTENQRYSELLYCLFSEAFILIFHLTVWTEMEEREEKKNQTCWRSHLWTVSNYCPPVLWFRSVTAFPACSVSQLFSIHLLRCFNILLKNTSASLLSDQRDSLTHLDMQWWGV